MPALPKRLGLELPAVVEFEVLPPKLKDGPVEGLELLAKENGLELLDPPPLPKRLLPPPPAPPKSDFGCSLDESFDIVS